MEPKTAQIQGKYSNIQRSVRLCCLMSSDVGWHILGTSWDQCRSMVQYSFTSTEARRLVRTDSPGRPPPLSHSSWTIGAVAQGHSCSLFITMVKVRLFCWWCCVCCIVLLSLYIIILRARHDHNKIHKTVSTNHNLSEDKGEPKRYWTEVLPLTSLTPYR